MVDPIYLGGDLYCGDLQRHDSPIERGDVCVESLYLGDGVEAMHRLIKTSCRRLAAANSHYGADSILKRSHTPIVLQNLPPVKG
jgi:hypothetical protein